MVHQGGGADEEPGMQKICTASSAADSARGPDPASASAIASPLAVALLLHPPYPVVRA